MPNGQNGEGKRDFSDRLMGIAQHAGKWGAAGLSAFTVQSVLKFAAHPSIDSAADALGSLGWQLIAVGLVADAKRIKTMTANNGADAAIGRAVIASQLPGPDLPVSASDPAVQRELERRVAPASTVGR